MPPHDRQSARVERSRSGLVMVIAAAMVIVFMVAAYDLYKAGIAKVNAELHQVQNPPR